MTNHEDAQFESMMAQSGIVLDPNEFLEREIEGRMYELDGIAGRELEQKIGELVNAVSRELTPLGIPPESQEFASAATVRLGEYLQANKRHFDDKELVVSGLGLVLLRGQQGDLDSVVLEPTELIIGKAWYLTYGKYALMSDEALQRTMRGERVSPDEIIWPVGPVVAHHSAAIYKSNSEQVNIDGERLAISPVSQMGLRIYQAKSI